jgi:hypothetical protein
MSKDKDYIEIRESIDSFRNVGKLLKEFNEHDGKYADNVDSKDESVDDAVPYTMQDELMANITQTAKTQFGADFSQSDKPMLYYPKDGDVVLSGTIGDMNDAKFQFRYKDSSGNGCYIWTEPLQLTDETIKKLSIINGVFKNWKNDLASAEDIKPMGLKNEQ